MKRRLGLSGKFIGTIISLISAIFVSVAVVLIHNNVNKLNDSQYTNSKAFATLATAPIGSTYTTYQDSGTLQITRQVANFASLNSAIANISVVNLQGQLKYNLNFGARAIAPDDADSFEPVYKYRGDGTLSQIVYPYIEDSGRHTYAVVYDISNQLIQDQITDLVRSIIIYTILGALVSAAATYLLINRMFLTPIKQLRNRAMLIAAGNYEEPINHDRNDEIGDLAGSVSHMAESLKQDIQKLKETDQVKSEFMMIASHNLRTPITIINGYVETLLSMQPDASTQKMLHSIGASSQRLGMFAEDMLMISSMEAGKKVFELQPLAIDDLVRSIGADFRTLAEEKQVNFIIHDNPTGAEIAASRLHLRNALWNLLDNALKFTDAGGEVHLSIIRLEERVLISIKDSGIGIDATEVGKLFTKFHRGTSTLSYNYEGTGIGLYVTKLIIDEHGGQITLDSTVGSGSTFTVSLPILQPAMPVATSE